MDNNSTQECCETTGSLTITLGSTVYTIEHIYGGSRSIQEVMTDFLEREVRNLDK